MRKSFRLFLFLSGFNLSGIMPLTNNSSFTQAEGLSEGSRWLERQRKPPVRSRNKYDPERVAETGIGRFWHRFQGAGILTRVRGYRFAQPLATFWQPFGLAKSKRQFWIGCQRHNPEKSLYKFPTLGVYVVKS
jgi:hypothetical protein